MFLQKQRAQVVSLLIDLHYPRAQAVVSEMSDLHLAIQNLLWEKLASEVDDLADCELLIAHHQETIGAHIENHAGKPGFPGIQIPPATDRNPRFRAQLTTLHCAPPSATNYNWRIACPSRRAEAITVFQGPAGVLQ
jgi:hypothetical protein